MADHLTDYFHDAGIKARYLHSDIDTLERNKVLHDLRLGEFDVLVGINLLREGLDLPEVSLVAILDADKEGFLRSARSLIQTIGRASRNIHGRAILYADRISQAMDIAITETNRRREIQHQYNQVHGITPQPIIKSIKEYALSREIENITENYSEDLFANDDEFEELISNLQTQMRDAAEKLEFEHAAKIRDQIKQLQILKTSATQVR